MPFQTATLAANAGVLDDVYTYDENANVTGIADQQTGIANRVMGYDSLDRLKTISASNLWGSASYGYDALDNLTKTTITAGTTARTTVHAIDAATNRLSGISGGPAAYSLAYQYDAQGNITKRGAQIYEFDLGNRMKSATGKATYADDGFGRRFSVVGADGVNRVQVYAQDGQLLYAGPTGGTGTKYVYLYQDRKITNVTAIGMAGVSGMVTGGLGGIIGRAAVAGTVSIGKAVVTGGLVGGAVGGAAKVTEAAINKKPVTSLQVAGGVGGGGLGSAAGTRLGLAAVAYVQKLASQPGLLGHVGETTQANLRESGRIVEPTTAFGQKTGLLAIESLSTFIETFNSD